MRCYLVVKLAFCVTRAKLKRVSRPTKKQLANGMNADKGLQMMMADSTLFQHGALMVLCGQGIQQSAASPIVAT